VPKIGHGLVKLFDMIPNFDRLAFLKGNARFLKEQMGSGLKFPASVRVTDHALPLEAVFHFRQ
jgi:hypothetical protein